MAYTPAATAHAVAVLLSTEEAEGITGSVSTAHHKNETLGHTSGYRRRIDFLMLFQAAWTNMHITRAIRQGTGESARDSDFCATTKRDRSQQV